MIEKLSMFMVLAVICIVSIIPEAKADMTDNHVKSLMSGSIPEEPKPFPPTTLSEWENQRSIILQRVKEIYKLPPDSKKAEWPLKARFIDPSTSTADVTIYRVVFQSRPSIWVTANLYVPKNVTFPVPGVLHMHGHSDDGKAAYPYRVAAFNLAKSGFVVLSVDCIGMGERKPALHSESRGGVQILSQHLVGNLTGGLEVWDNIRAIDYLCSLTQWVDSSKIGVLGRSGGGSQTIYLLAVDTRIVCAAPESSVGTYARFCEPGGSGNCECEKQNSIRRMADHYHLLSLAAPRAAILICATTLDKGFEEAGARETYNKARSIYDLYGAGSKISEVESVAGHTSTVETRQAQLGWFNYYLKGIGDGTPDPEPTGVSADISNTPEILCGYPAESTGTLISLAYDEALSLPPNRGIFNNSSEFYTYRDQLRGNLKGDVFGYNLYMPIKCALSPTVISHTDLGTYWQDKITYQSESDITITGYLSYRKGITTPASAIISISTSTDVQYLVDAGYVVFAFDPRPFTSATYQTHKAIIYLGLPLIGMRTWDVIRAVDYLYERTDTLIDKNRIGLYGKTIPASTVKTMYALYAAGLDDRIKATILDSIIVSYKAKTPSITSWSSSWDSEFYLPRILKYADITQLASIVAPRALLISQGVDTTNSYVTLSEIQTQLNSCVNTYQILGKSNKLSITTDNTNSVYLNWFNTHLALHH